MYYKKSLKLLVLKEFKIKVSKNKFLVKSERLSPYMFTNTKSMHIFPKC